jgi:hypothetical protein
MVRLFGVLRQFSAKNGVFLKFLRNVSFALSQKRHFFANFFGENILKIIASVQSGHPDSKPPKKFYKTFQVEKNKSVATRVHWKPSRQAGRAILYEKNRSKLLLRTNLSKICPKKIAANFCCAQICPKFVRKKSQ